MRRCPLCGLVYSDELIYCLQDGTSLVDDQNDQEIPTVIRPSRIEVGRKPFLKYVLLGLLGLLGVTIASALGAFLVWHWLADPNDERVQGLTPATSPAPPTTPTRRPATPSPTGNVSQIDRPAPAPARQASPEPAADEAYRDPGTSRITFRRGRVSESVTARVAINRSFVLRTMGGQYLTSSITSDGDCVVFSNGNRSTAFSTPAGDTRLDLRNNCGQTTKFTLTVTVR